MRLVFQHGAQPGTAAMPRVLTFLPRCVGDVVLSTPMLRQLRRLHPNATIEVVCSPAAAPVLAENPHIDAILSLRNGREGKRDALRLGWRVLSTKYDIVVDACCMPKTAVLARLSMARRRYGLERRWPRNSACYTHTHKPRPDRYTATTRVAILQQDGADRSDRWLEFPVDRGTQAAAERFAAQHFRRPVAAVYAASTHAYKQWPEQCYIALGRRLEQRGQQVFMIFGPGEEETTRRVGAAIAGDTVYNYPLQTLPMLRAVLAHCDYYAGNDGGPKHIAAAAGLPTVTVYGEIDPRSWNPPRDPGHRAVSPRNRPLGGVLGAHTDAASIAGIPVAPVLEQIELCRKASRRSAKPRVG